MIVIRHHETYGHRQASMQLNAMGLMSRVFANGPEDRGSIPG